MAGAQAIYERDRDWEKVRISGPLAEDIKVYVSIELRSIKRQNQSQTLPKNSLVEEWNKHA